MANQRNFSVFQYFILILFFPVTLYLILGRISAELTNLILTIPAILYEYWPSNHANNSLRIEEDYKLIFSLFFPLFFAACLIIATPLISFQLIISIVVFLYKIIVITWDFTTYLLHSSWFLVEQLFRNLSFIFFGTKHTNNPNNLISFRTGIHLKFIDYLFMIAGVFGFILTVYILSSHE